MEKKKKKWVLLGISIPVIVLIGVAAFITVKQYNQASREMKNQEQAQSDLDTIDIALQNLYNSNSYLEVITGSEDTDITFLVLNKEGQAYEELGGNNGISVYTDRTTNIILKDPVEIETYMTVIGLTQQAVDNIRNKNGTITKEEIAEQDKKEENEPYYMTGSIIEYTLSFENNQIKELFGSVSKEYAQEMVGELLQKGLEKLEIVINIADNNQLAILCTLTIEEKEYISWWFTGYKSLDDWSLQGWDNIKDKDIAEITSMAISLQETISNLLVEAEKTEVKAPENSKPQEISEDELNSSSSEGIE